MAHLLYPDEQEQPLPTFATIWNQGGDALVKKFLLQSNHGWDPLSPEEAPRGKSWLNLEKNEQHFCLEPKIAIHYFENEEVRYQLIKIAQDKTDPPHQEFSDGVAELDTEFLTEFSSLTQIARYLTKIGYFPPHTLKNISEGIDNEYGHQGRPHRTTDQADPISQLDSPAPTPSETKLTTDFDGNSGLPPDTSATSHTTKTQTALPPTENLQPLPPKPVEPAQENAGRYPLDLLFHLRHRDPNHHATLHTLWPIIARHPKKNIQATRDYTLFQDIDPAQPGIALKVSYQPSLQFSLESTLPSQNLPTELTNQKDLHQLLKEWLSFKPLLPLYRRLTRTYTSPGPNGFILPETPPSLSIQELDLSQAKLLNHYLEPKSTAQKRLIRICLDQKNDRSQPITEHDRLKAYGYALQVSNHPENSPHLPQNLTLKEALSLLSINAPSLCPPASPQQQSLYANITNALRTHAPLNQEALKSIANHFPQTCQNAAFINYVVKVLNTPPENPITRQNLVLYGCERADSRLLRILMRQSSPAPTFSPNQLETLSGWILNKAYPDQDRANRCLDELPLSRKLRDRLKTQLTKPRWNKQSAARHPVSLSI